MRRDLVQVPLDQPPAEPAPATSGPDRGIHAPGSRHRDRSRPSGLIGWLLVAIAGVGMLVSTPPSAGPDEPIQAVTAWYLSGHGLRSDSTGFFSVPVSLLVNPCFAHETEVTAGCMTRRTAAETTVPTSVVLNYPPPYYWVVGAGQRLAASLMGVEYADVGGRLAAFTLIFGTLLLLTLYMRRRNRLWGAFLLLVSTPMAVSWGLWSTRAAGKSLAVS
jgi:hypothetical protein